MAVTLESLILELKAEDNASKVIDAALSRAKQQTALIEKTLNRLNSLKVTTKVDDSRLTDLNKHLESKRKHTRSIQQEWNISPLAVRVNDAELVRLKQSLKEVRSLNGMSVSVRTTQTAVQKNQERANYATVTALYKILNVIDELPHLIKENTRETKPARGLRALVNNAASGVVQGAGHSIGSRVGNGVAKTIGIDFEQHGRILGLDLKNKIKRFQVILDSAFVNLFNFPKGTKTAANLAKKNIDAFYNNFTDPTFFAELEDYMVARAQVNLPNAPKSEIEKIVADSLQKIRNRFESVIEEDTARALGATLKMAAQPLRIRKRVQLGESAGISQKQAKIHQNYYEKNRKEIEQAEGIGIFVGGTAPAQSKRGAPATETTGTMGAGFKALFPNAFMDTVEPRTTVSVEDLEQGVFNKVVREQLLPWIKENQEALKETFGVEKVDAVIGNLANPHPIEGVLRQHEKGYSEDAIKMASKAMGAAQAFPDKDILLGGASGGGFIVEEAVAILNQMAKTYPHLKKALSRVKAIAIGTPMAGLTATSKQSKDDPVQFKAYMGNIDNVGKGFYGKGLYDGKIDPNSKEYQNLEREPGLPAGALFPSGQQTILPDWGYEHKVGEMIGDLGKPISDFLIQVSQFLKGQEIDGADSSKLVEIFNNISELDPTVEINEYIQSVEDIFSNIEEVNKNIGEQIDTSGLSDVIKQLSKFKNAKLNDAEAKGIKEDLPKVKQILQGKITQGLGLSGLPGLGSRKSNFMAHKNTELVPLLNSIVNEIAKMKGEKPVFPENVLDIIDPNLESLEKLESTLEKSAADINLPVGDFGSLVQLWKDKEVPVREYKDEMKPVWEAFLEEVRKYEEMSGEQYIDDKGKLNSGSFLWDAANIPTVGQQPTYGEMRGKHSQKTYTTDTDKQKEKALLAFFQMYEKEVEIFKRDFIKPLIEAKKLIAEGKTEEGNAKFQEVLKNNPFSKLKDLSKKTKDLNPYVKRKGIQGNLTDAQKLSQFLDKFIDTIIKYEASGRTDTVAFDELAQSGLGINQDLDKAIMQALGSPITMPESVNPVELQNSLVDDAGIEEYIALMNEAFKLKEDLQQSEKTINVSIPETPDLSKISEEIVTSFTQIETTISERLAKAQKQLDVVNSLLSFVPGDSGEVDASSQITSLDQFGFKQAGQIAGKVAGGGAVALQKGTNVAVGALLPAVKGLYGVVKGVENITLAMLPGGRMAKGLLQQTAVPAAAFGAATHFVPGGGMLAEGATHLAQGALNPLLAGAGQELALSIGGAIQGSLEMVPLVGHQLGTAITQGLTSSLGAASGAAAEIGGSAAVAIGGGKALLGAGGQAAKAVLNPSNQKEIQALPQSTRAIEAKTEESLTRALKAARGVIAASKELKQIKGSGGDKAKALAATIVDNVGRAITEVDSAIAALPQGIGRMSGEGAELASYKGALVQVEKSANAYMANKADEIKAIEVFARSLEADIPEPTVSRAGLVSQGVSATKSIAGNFFSTQKDIDRVQKTDPEEAKRLALNILAQAEDARIEIERLASNLSKKEKTKPVNNAVKDARSKITSAEKKAKSIVGNVNPEAAMEQLGEFAGGGLSLGLRGSIGDLSKVSTSLVNAVLTTVKTGFEIASPSKKMRRLGGFTGVGFVLGLKDSLSVGVGVAKRELSSLTQSFDEAVEKAKLAGKQIAAAGLITGGILTGGITVQPGLAEQPANPIIQAQNQSTNSNILSEQTPTIISGKDFEKVKVEAMKKTFGEFDKTFRPMVYGVGALLAGGVLLIVGNIIDSLITTLRDGEEESKKININSGIFNELVIKLKNINKLPQLLSVVIGEFFKNINNGLEGVVNNIRGRLTAFRKKKELGTSPVNIIDVEKVQSEPQPVSEVVSSNSEQTVKNATTNVEKEVAATVEAIEVVYGEIVEAVAEVRKGIPQNLNLLPAGISPLALLPESKPQVVEVKPISFDETSLTVFAEIEQAQKEVKKLQEEYKALGEVEISTANIIEPFEALTNLAYITEGAIKTQEELKESLEGSKSKALIPHPELFNKQSSNNTNSFDPKRKLNEIRKELHLLGAEYKASMDKINKNPNKFLPEEVKIAINAKKRIRELREEYEKLIATQNESNNQQNNTNNNNIGEPPKPNNIPEYLKPKPQSRALIVRDSVALDEVRPIPASIPKNPPLTKADLGNLPTNLKLPGNKVFDFLNTIISPENKKRIGEIRQEFNQLSQEYANLLNALKQTPGELFPEESEALQELAERVQNLKSEYAGLSQGDYLRIPDVAIDNLPTVPAAFKAVRSSIDDLVEKMPWLKQFKNMLGDIGRTALMVMGINTLGDVFVNFGKTAFQAAVEAERFSTAIGFATGKDGAKVLSGLEQQADTLGTSYKALREGYKTFSSAVRGTQLEPQTDAIFEGFQKGLSVRDASMEQQKNALVAVSQMASKGKVSMEELNQQLSDSGLAGASHIAARALGVTTAELFKLIESGQVLSQDLLPKMAAQLERESAGGLEAAASSLESQITKLDNKLTIFRENMGKPTAVVMKAVGFPVVNKALDVLGKNTDLIGIGLTSIGLVVASKVIPALWNLIIETKLAAAVLKALELDGVNSFRTLGAAIKGGLQSLIVPAVVLGSLYAVFKIFTAGSQQIKDLENSAKTLNKTLKETSEIGNNFTLGDIGDGLGRGLRNLNPKRFFDVHDLNMDKWRLEETFKKSSENIGIIKPRLEMKFSSPESSLAELKKQLERTQIINSKAGKTGNIELFKDSRKEIEYLKDFIADLETNKTPLLDKVEEKVQAIENRIRDLKLQDTLAKEQGDTSKSTAIKEEIAALTKEQNMILNVTFDGDIESLRKQVENDKALLEGLDEYAKNAIQLYPEKTAEILQNTENNKAKLNKNIELGEGLIAKYDNAIKSLDTSFIKLANSVKLFNVSLTGINFKAQSKQIQEQLKNNSQYLSGDITQGSLDWQNRSSGIDTASEKLKDYQKQINKLRTDMYSVDYAEINRVMQLPEMGGMGGGIYSLLNEADKKGSEVINQILSNRGDDISPQMKEVLIAAQAYAKAREDAVGAESEISNALVDQKKAMEALITTALQLRVIALNTGKEYMQFIRELQTTKGRTEMKKEQLGDNAPTEKDSQAAAIQYQINTYQKQLQDVTNYQQKYLEALANISPEARNILQNHMGGVRLEDANLGEVRNAKQRYDAIDANKPDIAPETKIDVEKASEALEAFHQLDQQSAQLNENLVDSNLELQKMYGTTYRLMTEFASLKSMVEEGTFNLDLSLEVEKGNTKKNALNSVYSERESQIALAETEVKNYQEQIENLKFYRAERLAVIGKATAEERAILTNMLGVAPEEATLGHVARAQNLDVAAYAPPHLQGGIQEFLTALSEANKAPLALQQAENGLTDAQAALKKLTVQTFEFRDALASVKGFIESTNFAIDLGIVDAQVRVKTEGLAGSFTERDAQIATADLDIQNYDQKIEALKLYQQERLKLIGAASQEEREILTKMLGGKTPEEATRDDVLKAQNLNVADFAPEHLSGNIQELLGHLGDVHKAPLEISQAISSKLDAEANFKNLTEGVETLREALANLKSFIETSDFNLDLSKSLSLQKLKEKQLASGLTEKDIQTRSAEIEVNEYKARIAAFEKYQQSRYNVLAQATDEERAILTKMLGGVEPEKATAGQITKAQNLNVGAFAKPHQKEKVQEYLNILGDLGKAPQVLGDLNNKLLDSQINLKALITNSKEFRNVMASLKAVIDATNFKLDLSKVLNQNTIKNQQLNGGLTERGAQLTLAENEVEENTKRLAALKAYQKDRRDVIMNIGKEERNILTKMLGGVAPENATVEEVMKAQNLNIADFAQPHMKEKIQELLPVLGDYVKGSLDAAQAQSALTDSKINLKNLNATIETLRGLLANLRGLIESTNFTIDFSKASKQLEVKQKQLTDGISEKDAQLAFAKNDVTEYQARLKALDSYQNARRNVISQATDEERAILTEMLGKEPEKADIGDITKAQGLNIADFTEPHQKEAVQELLNVLAEYNKAKAEKLQTKLGLADAKFNLKNLIQEVHNLKAALGELRGAVESGDFSRSLNKTLAQIPIKQGQLNKTKGEKQAQIDTTKLDIAENQRKLKDLETYQKKRLAIILGANKEERKILTKILGGTEPEKATVAQITKAQGLDLTKETTNAAQRERIQDILATTADYAKAPLDIAQSKVAILDSEISLQNLTYKVNHLKAALAGLKAFTEASTFNLDFKKAAGQVDLKQKQLNNTIGGRDAQIASAQQEIDDYARRIKALEKYQSERANILAKANNKEKNVIKTMLGDVDPENATLQQLTKAQGMDMDQFTQNETEITKANAQELLTVLIDLKKNPLEAKQLFSGFLDAKLNLKNLRDETVKLKNALAELKGSMEGLNYSLDLSTVLAKNAINLNKLKNLNKAFVADTTQLNLTGVDVEQNKQKLKNLEKYQADRLKILRAASKEERAVLKQMLGGVEPEKATVAQITKAQNADTGNIKASENLKSAANELLSTLKDYATAPLEIAQTQQSLIDSQIQFQEQSYKTLNIESIESLAKGFKDAVHGIWERYEQFIEGLTDQVLDLEQELKDIKDKIGFLDIKNSLRSALSRGSSGIMKQLTDTLIDILGDAEGAAANMRSTEKEELQIERFRRDSIRQMESMQRDYNEALKSLNKGMSDLINEVKGIKNGEIKITVGSDPTGLVQSLTNRALQDPNASLHGFSGTFGSQPQSYSSMMVPGAGQASQGQNILALPNSNFVMRETVVNNPNYATSQNQYRQSVQDLNSIRAQMTGNVDQSKRLTSELGGLQQQLEGIRKRHAEIAKIYNTVRQSNNTLTPDDGQQRWRENEIPKLHKQEADLIARSNAKRNELLQLSNQNVQLEKTAKNAVNQQIANAQKAKTLQAQENTFRSQLDDVKKRYREIYAIYNANKAKPNLTTEERGQQNWRYNEMAKLRNQELDLVGKVNSKVNETRKLANNNVQLAKTVNDANAQMIANGEKAKRLTAEFNAFTPQLEAVRKKTNEIITVYNSIDGKGTLTPKQQGEQKWRQAELARLKQQEADLTAQANARRSEIAKLTNQNIQLNQVGRNANTVRQATEQSVTGVPATIAKYIVEYIPPTSDVRQQVSQMMGSIPWERPKPETTYPTNLNDQGLIAQNVALKTEVKDANVEFRSKQDEATKLDIQSKIDAARKQFEETIKSTKQRFEDLQREMESLNFEFRDLGFNDILGKQLFDIRNDFSNRKKNIEDFKKEVTDMLKDGTASIESMVESINKTNLPQEFKDFLINEAKSVTEGATDAVKAITNINNKLSTLPETLDRASQQAINYTIQKAKEDQYYRTNSMVGTAGSALLEARAERPLTTGVESRIFKAQAGELSQMVAYQEQLRETNNQLRELGLQGTGTAQQILSAMEEVNNIKLDSIRSEMTIMGQAFSDFRTGVASSLLNSITSFAKAESSILESMRSLVVGILESIAEIAAKIASEEIIKSFFGMFGMGGRSSGGGGGFLGDVLGSFFAIAHDGMEVRNYADGGIVGGRGLAQAMKKERLAGGKPVPIVASIGEQILSTKNNDAQFYRTLKAKGTWDDMKAGKIDNFAYGGAVGRVAASGGNAPRQERSIVVHSPITVVSPKPESYRKTQKQIAATSEYEARRAYSRFR